MHADAVRRPVDHAPEVLAALPGRLLGLALAGDVDHHPEQLDRHAVDHVHMHVIAQPDRAAVGGQHPVNQLMILARDGLVVAEHRDVPVLGMEMVAPERRLVDPALGGVAEKRLRRGADVGETKRPRVGGPRDGRHGVEQTPQAILAFRSCAHSGFLTVWPLRVASVTDIKLFRMWYNPAVPK
jgi:hypothetical protein